MQEGSERIGSVVVDLDWGVDTLIARMQEARYAWVASNVIDSATGKRP